MEPLTRVVFTPPSTSGAIQLPRCYPRSNALMDFCFRISGVSNPFFGGFYHQSIFFPLPARPSPPMNPSTENRRQSNYLSTKGPSEGPRAPWLVGSTAARHLITAARRATIGAAIASFSVYMSGELLACQLGTVGSIMPT